MSWFWQMKISIICQNHDTNDFIFLRAQNIFWRPGPGKLVKFQTRPYQVQLDRAVRKVTMFPVVGKCDKNVGLHLWAGTLPVKYYFWTVLISSELHLPFILVDRWVQIRTYGGSGAGQWPLANTKKLLSLARDFYSFLPSVPLAAKLRNLKMFQVFDLLSLCFQQFVIVIKHDVRVMCGVLIATRNFRRYS